MVSSRSNTCRVWDCAIARPATMAEEGGGIEHLRSLLGPGRELAAGEVVWLTDMTPHEVLPINHAGHCSFIVIIIAIFHIRHVPISLGTY